MISVFKPNVFSDNKEMYVTKYNQQDLVQLQIKKNEFNVLCTLDFKN